MTFDTGTIQVPYPQLETACEQLTAANSQIETALADLKRKLDILQQQWKGQTKEAYAAAKLAWDARVAQMNAALLQIKASVDKAATAYQEMDKAGAALF